MNRQDAELLLRTAIGQEDAHFRDGQWEAIDALVNHHQKLLVVQRTGWGKSSVYFISTKIFRDRGQGPTIIVSPLLALMRNQIESAKRLGINAVTMNSTNINDWEKVKREILDGEVDCLLISPERLANDNFVETVLRPISDKISLMVVDEAHCISDWGHDFRPDYRRITNILKLLPDNTPVLGTTATANDRVVDDIQTQLGNIEIQRGSLIRESLALQNIVLPDQPSRLAWLAQVIPNLDNTGIVYVLTQRDAEIVSRWLNTCGIDAKPYYSGVTNSDFVNERGKLDTDTYREHLELQLLNNELKVLVATTALGMGYDKPDLGFVIHFQAPGSIVAFYQQVGRAGRGIDSAVGILMSGEEDARIHEFFRKTAFPTQANVQRILNALEPVDYLTPESLEKEANLPQGRIEHVLKFLAAEYSAPVGNVGKKWHRNPIPYRMDMNKVQAITGIREAEWMEMTEYLESKDCLMLTVRNALDDHSTEPCGKCENCIGEELLPTRIDETLGQKAAGFLCRSEMVMEPRKQIAASNDEAAKTFIRYDFPRVLGELAAEPGRILSRWGDAGWGQMVADDKHSNHFRDELVDATAEMIIERWQPEDFPTWVCCIPSLNHKTLVPDFAKRLADKLDLPFVDSLEKVLENEPQKWQQNRYHQCSNLDGAFKVTKLGPEGSVLLVDDVVRSKWTFTVGAALLKQAGSGKVYPVALASTSVND
ncbi:ATP-dependent DNA helicase RecQ [Photobacterium marinum]|uniref:DNA 3'-5' helicase n=1 Tax=Photobacterium marinum TaxID=1056511 RepID=L8JB97_9GAMM|nr:RecQ family ATP-dependent DNA helicase [Photobacterium marinum]ELR66125.1 ATP-dependent DNA helicase RecQ [Photobacterium marinum]